MSELVQLAKALEAVVSGDLAATRANDGTTALLAAANELRRRASKQVADSEILKAVAGGMSLRAAAASLGVGVSRIRTALARSKATRQ
jgi:hypothetical protein